MTKEEIWFILIFVAAHYIQVESSQCYRRSSCDRCIQAVACPQNKTHVNIVFQQNFVNIICTKSAPGTLDMYPTFDGRYLKSFDDSSPLTLDTMITKCFKTKPKHIKYAVELDKVRHINITKNLLKDQSELEYLYIGWINKLQNDSFISLEEEFLEHTPKLQTLILNHSDLRNLKSYLANLTGLINLDLSSNSLFEIPSGIFESLDHLEAVSFRSNNLRKLNNGCFSGAKVITKLDLSENKINNVENKVFSGLLNLTYLNLSYNSLKAIAEDTFSSNEELKVLDLSGNQDFVVSKPLFSKLKMLEKLFLINCGIGTLEGHVFDHLANLDELTLSQNDLQSLPTTIFAVLGSLRTLDLSQNKLESLPSKIFSTLKNLQVLSLRGNRLTKLDGDYFQELRSLKVLDLGSNQISDFLVHNFNNNVEKVILSYNKIKSVPNVFLERNSLQHLDVSHNEITSVHMKYPIPINRTTTVDVSHNRIDDIQLPDRYESNNEGSIIFNLTTNFVRCSCNKYKVEKAAEMNDLMQLTVLRNKIECSAVAGDCLLVNVDECPQTCDCFYRKTDTSLVIDCSYGDLTSAPTLEGLKSTGTYKHNQTIVILKGNNLNSMGPQKLAGYNNVTYLDLSDNVISDFRWVPPHLQYLDLDNNRLQNINRETIRVLEKTESLVEITLKNNPWKCECNSADLQRYLISFNNIKVNQTDVTCQSTGEYLIYTKICEQSLQNSLTVPISLTLLFAMLAIALTLYYRYNTSIKIYLYSKNCCLWCVAEEELDKEKTYDIFVSYSYKDEDFVQKQLLAQLEHPQRPFKVCIHYRDFIPGEFISKQIVDSVLNSRRTLVVLSNNFMESVWGKMEFRTAHTQAITEGRARVIVVIYGDLNEDSLDDEMKAYLKTNTYVKWGDPWFWNKLMYALPHSNNRFKNAEVIHIEETCGKGLLGCFKWLNKTRNITVGTGNKGSFDLESHSHKM
ncbi:protein toll-like [Cylas formicarius]|uniref:protein toll-like n=1 Tax=Cylas formicarius TaxID=197179 RepID=UPI002958D5DA|nr:protein toll-like [Cylas formicarius]